MRKEGSKDSKLLAQEQGLTRRSYLSRVASKTSKLVEKLNCEYASKQLEHEWLHEEEGSTYSVSSEELWSSAGLELHRRVLLSGEVSIRSTVTMLDHNSAHADGKLGAEAKEGAI